MFEAGEDALTKVLEAFEVGLADLAEEEAFQARHALAIVGTKLGDEPMGFAATACAAVANSFGAIRFVAEARGGAGGELPGLKNDPDV